MVTSYTRVTNRYDAKLEIVLDLKVLFLIKIIKINTIFF